MFGEASIYDDAVIALDEPVNGSLEVRIGSGTGKIEGRVTGFDPDRFSDVRVVLVPDEPHRRNPLRYRTGSMRSDGEFSILPDAAPGRYSLFAVSHLPSGGAELDPLFIERHAPNAVPVTAVPNQTVKVELKLSN